MCILRVAKSHVTYKSVGCHLGGNILPGTTMTLNPDALPSWDTPPPSITQNPAPSPNNIPTIPPLHTLDSLPTSSNPKLSPLHNTSSSTHQSSRTRAPSSRITSNDGLLPGRRLTDALSDSRASADHICQSRLSNHTSRLDE